MDGRLAAILVTDVVGNSQLIRKETACSMTATTTR